MRFKEFLLQEEQALLEGVNLEAYNAILPLLLINEEDGPPSVPNLGIEPTGPVVSTTTGGWARGPFNPYGGGGKWFSELYSSAKQYAVASRIADRLTALGIKGTGVDRIAKAKNRALRSTIDLLNNPQKTAYRIPVWTTKTPPKPVIKMWNEAFAEEFAKEMSRVALTG